MSAPIEHAFSQSRVLCGQVQSAVDVTMYDYVAVICANRQSVCDCNVCFAFILLLYREDMLQVTLYILVHLMSWHLCVRVSQVS